MVLNKSPFFATLRTFSSIAREICVQIENKVHHVNQLIEPDQMMYIQMAFKKTTPVFKIFFSLLTLSTAFLQKDCGPGKNNKCWSHIALFSRLYLIKLKVVVQLKSQQ